MLVRLRQLFLFMYCVTWGKWKVYNAQEPTADTNSTTGAVNRRVLTMCYLIERNTVGTTYDYNRAAAALELARQYANEYILPADVTLTSVYRDLGKRCGGKTHVIAIALGLRDEGINCDVYIGPGCGTAAEILHDLVSVWNIPIIGCPSAGVGLSAPASSYVVISRTSVTYVSITLVLLRFLDINNYTTPTVFQDQSMNFFQQLGVLMESTIKQLRSSPLKYGTKFVLYTSARDSLDYLREQMIAASSTSRVFVVCAAAAIVRNFMVVAHDLRMTKGDYVFIAIELFPSDVWGNFTSEKHDPTDSIARQAYRSLLLLSLKSETSEAARVFWRENIKLSREMFQYRFSQLEEAEFDPVVAHFYDSVLLFANTVSSMTRKGLNYSDGLAFTSAVANSSFESPVTGMAIFNGDSDRVFSFEIRFLNNKTGRHEAMMEFPAGTNIVKYLGQIDWVNGNSSLPPNVPRCGYRGDNPICIPVLVMSGGGKAGVAVGVLIFFGFFALVAVYVMRRIMFRNLDPFWWRILEQDLAINSSTKLTKSMTSSVVSGIASAQKKEDESTSADALPVKNGKTGLYNNILVSLHELPEPKLRVPPSISREAYLIKSMQHNNIQTFIGVCVNDTNLCEYIVAEICQKGSLQDLIEDQRMQLDWEFKNALIKDLTNGMVYIHSSPIQSHGFLNETTCQIDSRFVLKVGGFGLDGLRLKDDLEAYHISQVDHRNIRMLLWRAPELLRRAMPPAGTQKGDVYSYAILLQQIILRTEPFQKSHHHSVGRENSTLNMGDIIQEVCRGLTPPLRPPVPMSACSHALHELMANCWDEEPLSRPAFVKIRSIIQSTVKKSGDNIVDHLIKRMETYAGELETQVLTKTKEFMDERQRSAELLQEILPRVVAEALQKGHRVLPETYPSTTVFFSSVVGFKDAVSRAKSPLETVTMLNNLYGVCDGIIGEMDVFKVEVVSDAYLVVSGLPVRNGMRHVENIATMALQMRKDIPALAGSADGFKLRAGMHSGPCVAGVVGLKMPRYCLFGDTVNTASRMESHGEAGKIHVSPTSKALLDLHDDFVLVQRGVVNIKGKGEMTTHWLVGRN